MLSINCSVACLFIFSLSVIAIILSFEGLNARTREVKIFVGHTFFFQNRFFWQVKNKFVLLLCFRVFHAKITFFSLQTIRFLTNIFSGMRIRKNIEIKNKNKTKKLQIFHWKICLSCYFFEKWNSNIWVIIFLTNKNFHLSHSCMQAFIWLRALFNIFRSLHIKKQTGLFTV